MSEYCAQCGRRTAEGANFCSSCGAPLLAPGEDLTVTLHGVIENTGEHDVTVRVAGASPAVLVVNRGPEAGEAYLLDKPVTTAGRTPEADIFLDDVTVSRRHAEISHTEEGYVVRDAGSLNGTYVNHERVVERRLASGDEVQIGKFHLVFLSSETRAGEQSAPGASSGAPGAQPPKSGQPPERP